MVITGVSTHISAAITGANSKLSFVELRVARDLGVISPNINISNVRIPVDIPAPTLPNISIANVVAREDADRFTMLFPISIAESIFFGRSTTLRTLTALSNESVFGKPKVEKVKKDTKYETDNGYEIVKTYIDENKIYENQR